MLNQPATTATAREELVKLLRDEALVKGTVTLSTGEASSYYIDAKRALLRPAGFIAVAKLVARQAEIWRAAAVGGMTMGADPIACAALAGGAHVTAFFVRKEAKAHGLQRQIEGPMLTPGTRCMVVEDVVTTGLSTVRTLDALREARLEVCGVLAVVDRLAGGREAIEGAARAPFVALTTIDDVYPDRPDRPA